ncbi:MAG TPA: acyl-CoA dehydrogenase family protein [Smithella sp.]|nr:acyl-CoA dehydrogenase family protein [Smithella sp.]
MINLEMTQRMIDMKSSMNNMANSMLRPISRYYDENEHKYPQELDMFRSIKIMSRPKKKKASDEAKPDTPDPKKLGQNLSTVLVIEEMCWGDLGLLLSFPNAGLGNAAIAAVATDEQMARFGDKWASMAITEPGSGSDSGSITARATLDGNEWVLNGEKIFVTCAERAEVAVIWATVDRSAGKAGINPLSWKKERRDSNWKSLNTSSACALPTPEPTFWMIAASPKTIFWAAPKSNNPRKASRGS